MISATANPEDMTRVRDMLCSDYVTYFEYHGGTQIRSFDEIIRWASTGSWASAGPITPLMQKELRVNAIASAIEKSDPADVAETLALHLNGGV